MEGVFSATELRTSIASLNLADQKAISGIGEGVEINDLSLNKHKFIITQELDIAEDTSAFQYHQTGYALINIQPVFDTVINDPVFDIFTSLGDQILYAFQVKVNQTQNNCVAKIFRIGQDTPIWKEEFNNVNSDELILSRPVVLDGQTAYRFEITGEFLGDDQGKMYYSIGTRLGKKENLLGAESGEYIKTITAGNNVVVNDSDPKNLIISASGGGGGASDLTIDIDGTELVTGVDTLDFDSKSLKVTDEGANKVKIEAISKTETNFVGVFNTLLELNVAYPKPDDGLHAHVLQDGGIKPSEQYKSNTETWINIGPVAGDVFVDDVKSNGVVVGDGLDSSMDLDNNAVISVSGNVPVTTFDVTADSTRSVDSTFVGKMISIIQTPPSISIPMQITLSDHSLFKTGDTIKIAADRDGDDAYSNYYFAVYFNDSKGRQIAKYPANNITMVRTNTAWDVQLDGRFTNVSIRPKAQFNVPYEPDEQYNTPVNAFVFAESPAVEFEVDDDTNTRIVKVDFDALSSDDPTFKSISIDTLGSGQPNFTALIKQDNELHTVIDATRELRINYKDIGTGATTGVLGIDNNQAQFLVPIYQGNDQVALAKDIPVIPDNGYIEKYTRADTDYIQVAYQGKYGDDKVFSPATFNQDNNGWTFLKFTGYMKFQSRDKSTGVTGNDVLELRNDRVINKQEPYYNDKKLAVQESNVEFTKLQVQRSGRDFPPVSLFVDGYMNTIMEANGEFKFRYLDADGNATQTLQASTSKWNFLARPKYNNVNLVTNNEVYDIINDAIEPGSGISANSIRVARVTGYTNNYTSISYTDDKIQDVKFGKDNSFFETICYANSKLAYIMIHKDNVSASIGRDVDDGDLTLGVNTSSDAKISIGKYGQNLPTPVDEGVVAKISYNYYAMTMKLDNANQDANDPTQFLKSDGTITTDINEAQRMGYSPMSLKLNQSFNGREWGYSLIRGYIKSDKTFEADITSPYYVMAVTLGNSLTLTKQHTAGMNVGSLVFYNNPLDASLDQNPLVRSDSVTESIEENNDEIITPNKGDQFQIIDSEKSSSYGNASKKVTYFQPAIGTQSAMLLSNLDYGKAFAIHEEVNSTKLIMILHESLVAEIYNRDLTDVNELTMLFTGDSRGRLSKANQTADAQFAINWNGELIPATEDANELNPTMWVAQDDSVTETWSTSVKSVCYSSGVLANRGSAMLKRGDVIYSKPESLAESGEPLTENPRSLSATLSDSGETATITYDNSSEFFVMPIVAGGGTFNVMKVFQLFMSRKYQTMNEWGSFKFDESSDCIGTILKIAYDAAIAEEEKQEQAENDNLIEGLAQGFIYAKNVTVG